MKPITCSCKACASMCESSPCWPTPDEAIALINAGYGKWLSATRMLDFQATKVVPHYVIAPAVRGEEGKFTEFEPKGACTFYVSGKCELHALGLKPLEGRLAHHSRDPLRVREVLVKHWTPEQAGRVLMHWR